jgi:alpha-tubulin suppressor-like RCC1 family protein
MRIFRIAVATTLISIASSVVLLTASAAHAAPFTYSSVNVGNQSACSVTTSGQVLCWGENFDQHLIPTRTDRYINSPVPVTFPEAIATVDVGIGSTHCALGVSGRAYCWGTGGHLGSYLTTVSRTPIRVEFANDMRVTNVQNGPGNACALDSSRSLWCWGDPLTLGDGNVDSVRLPVRLTMPDNSPIAQYDMGTTGTCVITDASNMYCWGQINGSVSPWGGVPFPVVKTSAPTGKTWLSVSIEGERVCAITTAGDGYCRGDNYNGNFGNGTYDDSPTMTRMIVPNNESVQSIHMGSYATCIVTTVNNIWCAGEGGGGQLGTGTTLGGRTWRQPVLPNGTVLSRLSMSHAGTCGLDANDRIWCWAYIANYDFNSGIVYNNLLPVMRPQVGSPEVTAPAVTSITADAAILTSSASPFGFSTTGSFEVSTDSTFATSRIINVSGRSANDSFANLTLTTTLSALSPRTTYYVRAIARNIAGETIGATTAFVTLGSEPTILELSTSGITGNEATVQSEIDPGLLRTSASIEVSESADFNSLISTTSLSDLSGRTSEHRSAALQNLAPQHVYFARIVATNVLGTTTSEPIAFHTIGEAPQLQRIDATSNTSSVTVQTAITTGNTRGTITYQLSRTNTFSAIADSQFQSFNSSGPQNFSFTSYGLTLATDYWARAIVTNDLGSVTSAIVAVRTKGSAPVIGTLSAQPILQGVELTFPLDTTGINTMAIVDIATNGDMKNYTSHFAYSGTNDGSRTVTLTINRLSPTLEYFARVSAINSLGQTVSNIVSFRTVRPIGLVINDDEVSTENPRVTLHFRYPTDTVAIRISNNENFAGARIFSPTDSLSWELITSDEETTVRTIYVQFINGRGGAVLYTDEINLETNVDQVDEEAPIITSLRAVTAQSMAIAGTPSRVAKNTRRFVVSVSDKISGVTRIQTKVGARIVTQKVDALRSGEYSLSFARTVKSFSIRVIDRKGNVSKWKKISVR